MSKYGVMSKVTVCADCGKPLDSRPLREKDVSGSDMELPVYEAEIQAAARIAKAREVAEESGEMGALSVGPTGPSGPSRLPPRAGLQALRRRTGPVFCSKHGGEIAECDQGRGRANLCLHGKWGKLATFNRPCLCTKCHA
jgi:hypothetical protein